MSDAQQIASGNHDERVRAYVQALERENAALRCQAIGQEETIDRLQCTIKAAMHVEGQLQAENAALRHSEESLASTVRGLEFELEKAQKKVVALRAKVEQLERAILRYAHIEESLASTVRGLEFELEKANKQIDGLFAELSSTGADELREYRAENHQISQKASKLCYDLIAKERELEKANAALDWLNTHCMSAEPIMGRSTYRWTIEHDEPDIRAAIAELRKAQV